MNIMNKEEIIKNIVDVSNLQKIDSLLLIAICEQESNFDQLAKRFEEHVYKNIQKSNSTFYKEIRKNVDNWSRKRNVSWDTERADQSFSYGLFQIMGFNLRKFNYDYKDLSYFIYDVKHQIYFVINFLKNIMKEYNNISEVLSIYNSGKKDHRIGKIYAKKVMNRMKKWKENFENGNYF